MVSEDSYLTFTFSPIPPSSSSLTAQLRRGVDSSMRTRSSPLQCGVQ
jgi:hypothetical protein